MDLALPNVHPAVVHFPIVLIPLALFVDMLSLFLRTRSWNRAAATTWGAAALTAAAAFLAGRAAADSLVGLDAHAQPALSTHADWATWTLIGVSAVAGLRAVVLFMERWPTAATSVRVLLLTGGLGALGLVFWTADLGGALVYRHAVGVTVPECPKCVAAAASPSLEHAADVVLQVDGVATWLPKAPPDLDDVQFNAWIDLAQFHGEIQLLHHVTGDTSGAFSVHTDGPAQLLEIGSNDRVLATGTAALPARVALAVSASGGHFKGMVDGRTVVHGHSTAPPPGRVGLRVIGQGAVAIKEAEIIPLRSP